MDVERFYLNLTSSDKNFPLRMKWEAARVVVINEKYIFVFRKLGNMCSIDMPNSYLKLCWQNYNGHINNFLKKTNEIKAASVVDTILCL